MNDIFVDNNAAKHFIPPVPNNYKDFLVWLKDEGALVVSQKLLIEYTQGLAHITNQSIITIIGHLTKHGRLNKISSEALKSFDFKKHEENRFLCNHQDRDHLKTIFLSHRKLAISSDRNFRIDIQNFRRVNKIKPQAAPNPTLLDYR
jgi:hypothetical protein